MTDRDYSDCRFTLNLLFEGYERCEICTAHKYILDREIKKFLNAVKKLTAENGGLLYANYAVKLTIIDNATGKIERENEYAFAGETVKECDRFIRIIHHMDNRYYGQVIDLNEFEEFEDDFEDEI